MTIAQNRLSELYGVDATDVNALTVGVSNVGVGVKVRKIAIGALTTGVKDTGFDFPVSGLVHGVYLDIDVLEATASTKTIDVGLLASETGGDEDGFLDGASTAAAVGVRGTITVTDGTNQNFVAAAPTLGVLLRSGALGTDAAGEAAELIMTPHVLNGTARSLTYTLGSAHTELVGSIVVVYEDFDR